MTADDFVHNRSVIHDRIAAAGGSPDRIRLIAVSKGQPAGAIAAAIEVGQRDFGENYAEELVEKAQALAPAAGNVSAPVWHFQGRLQSNKINKLKAHVQWWHTVDSRDRAAALALRVPAATVLVQIDATGGAGDRSGVVIAEVPQLVGHARELGLNVTGLMTVAPFPDGAADLAYATFAELSALADELGLPERSMGMSADLESAVRAGTTIVRVGSALFGPRR
jgi:PLP dependent protein